MQSVAAAAPAASWAENGCTHSKLDGRRMRCTAQGAMHRIVPGFCYLRNENCAVCVVPSVSRTVRVPHFPAHDFSVFHTKVYASVSAS